MKEKCCGTCQYYRRHYVRYADGRYFHTPYGHCVYPRLKRRSRDDDGCIHWKVKEETASR